MAIVPIHPAQLTTELHEPAVPARPGRPRTWKSRRTLGRGFPSRRTF